MERKEQDPSMVALFVRHCLLFRSKERLFRFFGVLVWVDLFVLVYALTRLVSSF
ncbi:MAG: hypothetical protein LOY03_05870 [Cyclobacteriaceae bacterium]|jgi:hypothetical protein|nr:hypothetical protein [Cyclobacteriaceae bacterium]